MYEHSDRGRYVTEQVELWLANDYEYYQHALVCIKEGRAMQALKGGPIGLVNGGVHSVLATSITMVLRRAHAHPYSAAWYVAQELAPNDYQRIDWASIVAELEVA
jgi:hypothetical protein